MSTGMSKLCLNTLQCLSKCTFHLYQPTLSDNIPSKHLTLCGRVDYIDFTSIGTLLDIIYCLCPNVISGHAAKTTFHHLLMIFRGSKLKHLFTSSHYNKVQGKDKRLLIQNVVRVSIEKGRANRMVGMQQHEPGQDGSKWCKSHGPSYGKLSTIK